MPDLTVLTEMPPSARGEAVGQIEELRTYMIRVQQELEYLLTHLDEKNISEALLRRLMKKDGTVDAGSVVYDGDELTTIIRQIDRTIVENEEDIDELRTSRRVQKYILSDTSDDNYVHIKGEFVRFITGTVVSNTFLETEDGDPILSESGYYLTEEVGDAAVEQARNRCGKRLYWQREPVGHTDEGYPLDAEGERIFAETEPTSWPVTQYKYTELVKSQIAFEALEEDDIPKLILGIGDEFGRSKGYIYKDEDSFKLRYNTRSNKDVDITFSEDGFVDAMHRRLKSCVIDRESGLVGYTVEGSDALFALTFTVDGDAVTYTWPDGHQCEVSIL